MHRGIAAAVVALTLVVAPQAAQARTYTVVGHPAVGKKSVRIPALATSGAAGTECGQRLGRLTVRRSALRTPANLRPGDRISSRRGGVRVLAHSKAPTFAQLSRRLAEIRTLGRRSSAELAAIARLPPDARGGQNFASADQARSLGTRLNLLDERLLALAGALDRSAAGTRSAFRTGAACRSLRRARDRRVKPLTDLASAARRASKAIEAGTADIDRIVSFVPAGDSPTIPISTVGAVRPAVQTVLDLLNGKLP